MQRHLTILVLAISFQTFNVPSAKAEESAKITVAKDGSGDFASIQEAINSCNVFRSYGQVIYIKNGIYLEKVLFIECEMGEHIKPEGWHNWNQPDREKTAFYAEYKSTLQSSDKQLKMPLVKETGLLWWHWSMKKIEDL